MKKIKPKMLKKEISLTKRSAKERKNRRLSDGEARRVMAVAWCDVKPTEIVDIDSRKIVMNEEERVPLFSAMAIISDKKVKSIQRKISKEFDRIQEGKYNIDRLKNRGKNKNRRLSKKQFERLMKKASKELGINNEKTFPILDLDVNDKPKKLEECFENVLCSMSYSHPSIYMEYKKLTKGKKIKLKDKFSILGWLMYPSHTSHPFCLLSKKERSKEIRKIGLKTKGDIKIRPVRIMPDEHYLKEIGPDKRTKRDAFDELDNDGKIEWARHAQVILGESGEYTTIGCMLLFPDVKEVAIVVFAMKYACKMCEVPVFKGIFAEPYWIIYRMKKFCEVMTSKEYNTFMELSQDFVGESKKKIKIVSVKEAITKLMSTLRGLGLLTKYKKWFSKNKNKINVNRLALQKISELIKSVG